MTKHEFEPVVYEEPKDRKLRPLFVGRIADALDSVAGIGALLFCLFFIFGGVGLLAYNLYFVVVALVSRGAWLPLSSMSMLVLVVAIYFWRSPLITRLIVLSVLALLSFVASPILERVLS